MPGDEHNHKCSVNELIEELPYQAMSTIYMSVGGFYHSQIRKENIYPKNMTSQDFYSQAKKLQNGPEDVRKSTELDYFKFCREL